jgi:excisionase family DNA binding protein
MARKLLEFKTFLANYPFKAWTIRTYCSQGKIPHIKIGRRVYFDEQAIEEWLKNQEKPAR